MCGATFGCILTFGREMNMCTRWGSANAVVISLFLLSFMFFIVLSSNGDADLETIVQFRPESCSDVAANGDNIQVHYTGVLKETGAVFDSSIQAGREPIKFILGKQMVIKGWEMGILGMCVGEKRKLVIPPHLAYGKQGRPPVIPGDSTLIFETELISIDRPTTAMSTDKIAQIAGFILGPIIVGCLIYHLYKKVMATPSKKNLKEERRKKKKR